MSVLIGRRELFAFAERYSSCRLKDYTDLADGVVLCGLFNLVFPDLRIRTASPQTHTPSQRTQVNWAALRSALDDVGIPPNLLDQAAIQHGDAEKGFSALVLFYFLYHLTKRTDFSAEFATDVSEQLTEFLQSIDSIAALVVGGALPLTAVPPQLQEPIRNATMARKRRPASRQTQRREGSVAASSLEVSEEDDGERFERQLSFDTAATSLESRIAEDKAGQPVHAPNDALASRRRTRQPLHQDKRKRGSNHEDTVSGEVTEKARSCSTSSRSSQATRGERTLPGASVVEREVELQQALIAKSEECEKLKGQRMELLSQLAKSRAGASVNLSLSMSDEKNASMQELEEEQRRVAMLEEELMCLRRILQRTREERCGSTPASGSFAAELLKDVVDTETGELVNVLETATSLHGVLLDALRDSPRRRHDAQRWLWLIVSAYHVIETRLVTACDLAAVGWQRLEGNGGDDDDDDNCNQRSRTATGSSYNWITEAAAELQSTPNTTAKQMRVMQGASPAPLSPGAATSVASVEGVKLAAEMERRQRQFEQQLAELHTNEKNLRQRVHQLETHLRRFATKAIEREVKWKSLCAAIHEAERTSFGIAEAETTEEVEQLLTRRQSWYARAEEESAVLMQQGAEDTFYAASEPAAGAHDVCEAMQTLVLSVTQDRDRLQRELKELRKELQAPVRRPQKSARTSASKEVIKNRLLEQMEYEQDEVWFVRADSRPPYTLSSPSTKDVSATPAKVRRVGEQDAAIPFARNLSALLASATPV
ncbi:62 kDa protein Tc-1 [Trypanosoma conorhini]|uniref:62 kDa protein Tc-1 n=1 Tax=Trypanosoma conorhini TaxID=83891 RepID=A0A3R7MWT4_9TRYP|nr:62 kDa protein Tc-1 [Trypanosoma conorhini]RNF21913.1 62 kDa protein Tc-1 [Trypanosoma conorhini]